MREGLAAQGGEASMRGFYEACFNGKTCPLRLICEQCGTVARALACGSSSQTWRSSADALGAVLGPACVQGSHAAEVVRDLLPTPLMEHCTDLDRWAPVDEPTRRCLNRLHGRAPAAAPPADQLLRELLAVFGRRMQLWPASIAGAPSVELGLPELRAQLAEFERYLRARAGRPERSTFHPRAAL
ncbi:unnamed protein product [Prorocentrum cordatum]|uniref:Uncharacterized protein n=1 Tax=Prorocentrum cordatum TaxID=2364126 RepID=A0ABN9W8K2_9DINO|nr:unnamed protein product [Polarella glacialis]